MSRNRKAEETTGSLDVKSKKLSVKASTWINCASLYLFPVTEKQSLHPADGWLICTGGLLVAKTGYGVVEIRNSRDQNCQHGFQRFIFSMLSAAWLFFRCQKHPTVHKLTVKPKCPDAFSEQTSFLGTGVEWFALCTQRTIIWNDEGFLIEVWKHLRLHLINVGQL